MRPFVLLSLLALVGCGGGNLGNANGEEGGLLYGPACQAAARCCREMDASSACSAVLESNVDEDCAAFVSSSCDAGAD